MDKHMSDKEKDFFSVGYTTGMIAGFILTNWVIFPKLSGVTLLQALLELMR